MSAPENPTAFPGISLRDLFAGQALTGIIAGHRTDHSFTPPVSEAVLTAYEYADAMLRRRRF